MYKLKTYPNKKYYIEAKKSILFNDYINVTIGCLRESAGWRVNCNSIFSFETARKMDETTLSK